MDGPTSCNDAMIDDITSCYDSIYIIHTSYDDDSITMLCQHNDARCDISILWKSGDERSAGRSGGHSAVLFFPLCSLVDVR